MHRVTAILLLALAAVSTLRAGGIEPGEREVALRYSSADLDLGTYVGVDLGSEPQQRISLSIGWARTRVLQLGLDVSRIEMEPVQPLPWIAPAGDGYSYGVYLHANIPTRSVVTPYFGLGLSILGGDVRELYDWDADLAAGLKIYPGRRFGIQAAASYDKFIPGGENPGAEGLRLSLGGLFKF